MATFRDFPWRKVPAYIFAQTMGGLCGAGIIYANYIHAIDLVEGGRHIRTVPGTASLFSTYAVRTPPWVFSAGRGQLIPALLARAAPVHDVGLVLLRRGQHIRIFSRATATADRALSSSAPPCCSSSCAR